MANNYGPWAGKLTAITGNPAAVRILLTTVGAPDNGSSIALVLTLIASSLEHIGKQFGLEVANQWARVARAAANAARTLAHEMPSLTIFGPRELALDVYGPFVHLADSDTTSLPPAVWQAIGLLVLVSIRDQGRISAKVADQILTLARTKKRKQPNAGWLSLYELAPITRQALEDLNGQTQNRPCSQFARHLLSAWTSLTSIPLPPDESVAPKSSPAFAEPAASTTTNQTQTENNKKKNRKKKSDLYSNSPPSCIPLRERASFANMQDVFGIPWAWHRLHPMHVAKTTRALIRSLGKASAPDERTHSVFCLMALIVSHDFRPLLRLSLQPNDDLWYCLKTRCVIYNRRRLLGLKGAAKTTDYIYIPVPSIVANELAEHEQLRPQSENLRKLLNVIDVDDWLSRAESFIRTLGDSAHLSCSARFAHSLGLVHLLCGTSDCLTSLLTLNLDLSPIGALNYFQVSEKYAFERIAAVYEYLGLGPLSARARDVKIGSSRCPTDEEARTDWMVLGFQAAKAIFDVEHAVDMAAVAKAFNIGSTANAMAYRWPTGSRPQKLNRLSHADLKTHPEFLFHDEKRTKPSSARLTPRTHEVDDVLAAQEQLVKVAKARMKKLGIAKKDMPSLISSPSPGSPFFIELVNRIRGGQSKWCAKPLSTDEIENLARGFSGIARNGARNFWVSKAGVGENRGWLERTLAGHSRGQAGVGGWSLGCSPVSLLRKLHAFMTETICDLKLPPYLGTASTPIKMLTPRFDLRYMDRRAAKSEVSESDMPVDYCHSTTLPAIVLVDSLRRAVGDFGNLSADGQLLLSLMVMDGLTNRGDVNCVWTFLQGASNKTAPVAITWTRASGQEIEMPLQPSSRLHLSRAGLLPTLTVVAQRLRTWLESTWPSFRWPTTAAGVISALCWLTARWVRLNMAPLLVYAYDPKNRAVTFDSPSRQRLQFGTAPNSIGALDVRDISVRKTSSVTGRTELRRLVTVVWNVAKGNLRSGGDERRAGKLLIALAASFDLDACKPLTAWAIRWLIAECNRWKEHHVSCNQISVLYSNLTRLRERLDLLPADADPTHWNHTDWQRFAKFILDVSQLAEAKRPGAHVARQIALHRIAQVLTESGQYTASSRGVRVKGDAGNLPIADSAARVFVSEASIDAVRAATHIVYSEWKVEAAQATGTLEITIQGCARSDEINALRACDVSADLAALTTIGFSQIKTDGSRRAIPLEGRARTAMLELLRVLKLFPHPPEFLFSSIDTSVNLNTGRDRQAVITHLFRLVLGSDEFVWHTLRGVSLMNFLVPGWEHDVKTIFRDSFPLAAAQAIVSALAGNSPSHVALCLGRSGHASQQAPVTSYLAAWAYWYAALMRATQSDYRVEGKLADVIPGRNWVQLRAARTRAKDHAFDEWRWAIQHWCESQIKKQDLHLVQLPQTPPIRSGIDDKFVTKLWYGARRAFGDSQDSAVNACKVGKTQGMNIDNSLSTLPAFEHLHVTSVRTTEKDKEDRPRRSMIDLLNKAGVKSILEMIAAADSPKAEALQSLLHVDLSDIGLNILTLALSALPVEYGLEVAWRLDRHDPRFEQDIKAWQSARDPPAEPRVFITRARSTLRSPIRVRLIELAALKNDVRSTYLTTITRTILEVRCRLIKKEHL
jgi:hypothetical protein